MRSRSTSRTALIALSLAAASFAAACGSSPGMGTTPPPVEEASFTIALAAEKLPVLQGGTASVEVTLTRKAGFTGAVTLSDAGLPAGASFAPVVIAEGETKATLVATALADAPHSLPTSVTIRGTAGELHDEEPLTVTIYGAPGTLDTSFASGGKLAVPVGIADDYAFAMAAQPDGKLLIAGRAAEHKGDLALVRLERDGAVDTSFGVAGKVMTDVAGGADTAYAVAVQADGKIVVAGAAIVTGTAPDFVVARYLPTGALDTTFGAAATPGLVTTAFGDDADTAYALVIQPDGKIVVGGESSQGTSKTGIDFALARYDANGALDATFGDVATPGKVVTAIASSSGRDSIYALALQEVAGERRIVAAGGEGDFVLARYTANGQLDVGFGAGGKIARVFDSVIGAARAVQVAADGKLLVAGNTHHDFALVRLGQSGQLDATFGGSAAGKVVTPVSATNWDEAQGLALENDGKIVVAGWAYEGNSSSGNFALARYATDGALDATFGGTGTVVTPVASGTKADQGSAVLLQIDERIPAVRVVVAGSANGSNSDFAIARYWR
jgi:uncharacterized delta-60 repeat protein